MKSLGPLIKENEDWLINRILQYALDRGYAKYTSTLEEAWRISISGLSQTILEALDLYDGPPELGPDDDYSDDPIVSFSVLEAQRHRQRGIPLSMFLGLMKYYRQSYMDLLREKGTDKGNGEAGLRFVERCFDRIEIAFCTEWLGLSQDENISQIQDRARQMTNEKNKYLTIFESLHEPVILINNSNEIENMNQSATRLFSSSDVPGQSYYGEKVEVFLDSLGNIPSDILFSDKQEGTYEAEINTRQGLRYFSINVKRMLDFSEKFSGAVIILQDLTERRKMEKSLRIMATQDAVTGLFNRGWYMELTAKEISRAKRYGFPLCLIMMDIDYFKQINDTYGHLAGDQVLNKVGTLLKRQVRTSDILGRIGGEEFAITMIACELPEAYSAAERLRNLVAQSTVLYDKKELSCTVSCGVAGFKPQEQNFNDLFRLVDRALYTAKNRGRNRVEMAETGLPGEARL